MAEFTTELLYWLPIMLWFFSMKPLSEAKPTNLDGCLLVWSDANAPISIYIEDNWLIPIFSSEDKLRQQMADFKIEGYTIKLIMDGRDFLDCMCAQHIRVILDPRYENGVWRFKLCLPMTQAGHS